MVEQQQFRGTLPYSLKAVIFGPFSTNHFQYSAKAFGELFFLRFFLRTSGAGVVGGVGLIGFRRGAQFSRSGLSESGPESGPFSENPKPAWKVHRRSTLWLRLKRKFFWLSSLASFTQKHGVPPSFPCLCPNCLYEVERINFGVVICVLVPSIAVKPGLGLRFLGPLWRTN